MRINHSKSSFIPFGMSEEVASHCAQELRTPVGSLPIIYLGLPLSDQHIGSRGWTPVVERMEKRIQGWSSRMLSRGGRLILLRSVLSSIPIYYLSVLRLPAQVERRLNSIQSNFLWQGGDAQNHGIHLVAWSEVCRPTAQGGLGVRNLRCTNLALLGRWIGRIMGPSTCLWSSVFFACYGRDLSWVSRRRLPRGASHLWSSLSRIFPLMRPFFTASLGCGSSFSFWHGEWMAGGTLGTAFPRLMALAENQDATVSDCWSDGSWLPIFRTGLSDGRLAEFVTMMNRLTAYHPVAGNEDGWTWLDGSFSASRLYRKLLPPCTLPSELSLDYRRIWKSAVPLKIKIFMWLLRRGRILTKVYRSQWAHEADTSCVLCAGPMEDCDHLFGNCPVTTEVWRQVRWSTDAIHTTDTLWSLTRSSTAGWRASWRMIMATTWAIWLQRNQTLFRGERCYVENIVHHVFFLLGEWGFG